MVKSTHRLGATVLFGIAVWFGWGCAGVFTGPLAYGYFAQPPVDDPWGSKIEVWQARERVDQGVPDSQTPTPAVASGADSGATSDRPADLRSKYAEFRQQSKRALARDLADWIQEQAQQHYIADGPIDHWATLEETFRTNGDDCDGLELLVYNLLRDLGFGDQEVFRAIVYRRSDKQHHMVTFWFEDPNDPWVIDPTGAMTTGMPRMSEMPGWAPLKVFGEDSNYNVDQQRVAQQ
ncbi:MAG: hypothetical protein JRD03_07385 [Deltaproteobacteria bacterium]|nr:hypothetical protein [Deltaproteobacteria bacterium]